METLSLFDSPNETGSPERRLLLAIIERAILDFVGNDRKESEGAHEWLFSDDDGGVGEFTFSWVCSELDLDPERIRHQIRNMPKRGNSRIAPWYMTKNYRQKESDVSMQIANLDDHQGFGRRAS